MQPQVQMQLIQTIGTVLVAISTPVGAYFIAKMYARLGRVEGKVDGQLSGQVELKELVAFSKGQDQQRDKQEIKEAVAAGIIQANGK